VLRAPFGGTVSAALRARTVAAPGQPLLLLADLAHLHVETTDLNEIDAARVAPGASVHVTFDALPELALEGTVTRLALKAAAGSGVNYTAVIELAQGDPRLRWDMTAFVDIAVDGE
jgi:multidrug resistance efflux pump